MHCRHIRIYVYATYVYRYVNNLVTVYKRYLRTFDKDLKIEL